MDALVAVDHLRHPQVDRDRAQRVGVLRTQATVFTDQRDHVAQRGLGGIVEVLVKTQSLAVSARGDLK